MIRLPISDFEGYFVDQAGCVYKHGLPLKLLDCGMGYKRVGLWVNGKMHNKRVHRLVAAAFLSDFTPGLQVNHLDGNKHNNAASNLEMVSAKNNIAHASKIGRHNNKPKPLLESSQFQEISARLKNGESTISIAKDFGRSQRCIQY